MTCEQVRREIEDPLALSPTASEHVAGCTFCAAYTSEIATVRDALGVVPPMPDLLVSARAEVRRSRRLRSMAPLVSLAAGVAIGAGAMLGWLALDRPPGTGAAPPGVVASISERLENRLPQVDRFTAAIEITERNWHPDISERRYEGRIDVRGPEQFRLLLNDLTVYPGQAWEPNDVSIELDRGSATVRAGVPCTQRLLPACGRTPIPLSTVNRVPFSVPASAEFEFVVPVGTWTDSWAASSPTHPPPTADAVGIDVTFLQAEPLLSAFLTHGTWRDFYPADRVTVWLEPASLTPMSLSVRALDSATRSAWASSHGYLDAAGETILEIEIEMTSEVARVPVPAGKTVNDGFDEGPSPAEPLLDFDPYRSGAVSGAAGWLVETWTSGLAWIRVDTIRGWASDSFPGPPTGVIPTVTDSGPTYLGVDGSTLYAYTHDGVVRLTTNSTTETLISAFEALQVVSITVPAEWIEAKAISASEADLSGLLAPPELDSVPASVSFADGRVTITGWLGGEQFFDLTATPGTRLRPPSGASATGVEVRDTTARYSPDQARLDWVENTYVYSLHAEGFDLTQLGNFADRLVRR